jgi:thymidylate kinase
MYRNGGMSDVEWEVYCGLWGFLESHYCVQPDHILYLRTPADVCLERIKARGREEESGITLEYLKQLEEMHDGWLLEHPYPKTKDGHRRAILLDGTRRWAADDVLRMLRSPGRERDLSSGVARKSYCWL